QISGQGRDVRDSTGAGDAEYWRQEWEKYEDDHAVVDVDVRGWVYTPHRGQMNRKHRLFVGLARQLSGLPAPAAPPSQSTPSSSTPGSRATSPHQGHRERVEERQRHRDEDLIAKEAESILKKGQVEADAAGRGAYSEKPAKDDGDTDSLSEVQSANNSRQGSLRQPFEPDPLRRVSGAGSIHGADESSISGIEKRASWNQPADMSAAQLAAANSNLMQRLMPFLANPLVDTTVSAFFFNDERSMQKTTQTNSSGHFTLRAALDFIPTQVRVMVSDKLSVMEDVIITDAKGVSVISDIDDTIKHSAIASGAREIFRNAFIRDLSDLTIQGVKEWYSSLSDMGVQFHYVSNSPWQLYPVLTKYFQLAGLPPGSFHLKQYTGMLQGIFEPVAERKKGTLDRIARDFPERRFILIGDSGEADLEVYTDFVLENPGRVLAVFVRDVTTAAERGFFDSSMGPLTGPRSSQPPVKNDFSLGPPARSSQYFAEDDDPELKAAISASLRDIEERDHGSRASTVANRIQPQHSTHGPDVPSMRPTLPARRPTEPAAPQVHQMNDPIGDLIDFSEDEKPPASSGRPPPLTRAMSETVAQSAARRGSSASMNSRKPPPPSKPSRLRSPSNASQTSLTSPFNSLKPPPPKPRRPSTDVRKSSDQSSHSNSTNAPDAAESTQPGYATSAKQAISSAYNHLPSPSDYLPESLSSHTATPPSAINAPNGSPLAQRAAYDRTATSGPQGMVSRKKPPPPPPPRRGLSSYPMAAAHYASNRVSGMFGSSPPSSPPLSGRPGVGSRSNSYSSYKPARRQGSSASSESSSPPGSPGGGPLETKKEAMWRQRWERAQQVMRKNGVVLRSWRVGSDVRAESERLVKEAQEREGRASKGKPAKQG
ncbi:hypothetical protein LTS18_005923, partial [Coniosporium uncinatum]